MNFDYLSTTTNTGEEGFATQWYTHLGMFRDLNTVGSLDGCTPSTCTWQIAWQFYDDNIPLAAKNNYASNTKLIFVPHSYIEKLSITPAGANATRELRRAGHG